MPRTVPAGSNPVQISFGNTVAERPYHGACAMSAISKFSNVESGVRRLYLGMLGQNPRAAAMTFSVLRNSRAQQDAIFAVAADIDLDGQEFLKAFLKVYKSVGKRRDQLAHHVWATEPQFPEDVALVEPNALLRFEASTSVLMAGGIKSLEQVESLQKELSDAVRLWSLDDFKNLDADCGHTTALSVSVLMAVSATASERQREDARELLGGTRMLRDYLPERLRREAAERQATQGSQVSL